MAKARGGRAGLARCRQLGEDVGVLDVMAIAGRDEKVLPAVEVHVEEDGAP